MKGRKQKSSLKNKRVHRERSKMGTNSLDEKMDTFCRWYKKVLNKKEGLLWRYNLK